jgi:hypothetical protein
MPTGSRSDSPTTAQYRIPMSSVSGGGSSPCTRHRQAAAAAVQHAVQFCNVIHAALYSTSEILRSPLASGAGSKRCVRVEVKSRRQLQPPECGSNGSGMASHSFPAKERAVHFSSGPPSGNRVDQVVRPASGATALCCLESSRFSGRSSQLQTVLRASGQAQVFWEWHAQPTASRTSYTCVAVVRRQ